MSYTIEYYRKWGHKNVSIHRLQLLLYPQQHSALCGDHSKDKHMHAHPVQTAKQEQIYSNITLVNLTKHLQIRVENSYHISQHKQVYVNKIKR